MTRYTQVAERDPYNKFPCSQRATARYLLLVAKRSLLNIWRNARRSAITVLMIVIGTIAVILLGGYFRVMEIGLRDSAINNQYGHFQVAAKGYFDASPTDRGRMIDAAAADAIVGRLKDDPSVDLVNRRVFLSGLIGKASVSAFFTATCGESEAEALMIPPLMDGSPPSSDDPYGIIIGREMAEVLGADVGAALTLAPASPEGAREAVEVRVRGIYRGLLKEQEQTVVYLPLQAALDLMGEDRVHNVTVLLKDGDDLARVLGETEVFASKLSPGLELRSWDQLAVYFKQILGMLANLAAFGGTIVFIVIVFGISNTMYIAVAERTREIGTTRALGDSRADVIFSFMVEGILLGLLGAAVGTAISLTAIPIVNSLQIMLPPGPGQDEMIPIVLLADRTYILAACLLDVITSALASLLPAFWAARQRIADSLRQG